MLGDDVIERRSVAGGGGDAVAGRERGLGELTDQSRAMYQ